MRDKKLKYLVICESPNKTHHLQEYIKAGGYNVHVMASVGHIAEIRNGGSYYNTGINPTDEFKMDLGISPDKKDIVNKLKTQVDWADHVVLATDGDNEGAQISWSLIKFLKLKKDTYTRMITHEITPKAVLKAFENPIPLDTDNALASQARMCLDKMLGYRLSPISKTYVGARSVGRCQSVGLKIIADREREIQNFIPETYFDIYVNFEKSGAKFKAKYIGTDTNKIEHLKTQADVDAVKALCIKDYVVKDITEKTQIENAPLPYITATIQQDAANKLGLSVKDTMSICQKNFENGFITYHRSDSPELSVEFVDAAKKYILTNYDPALYVGQKKIKLSENAQDGHEAIRCTNIELTPERAKTLITNDLQWKVYRMVWIRTIQSLLKAATYATQAIIITNNGQNFIINKKVLKDPGFKSIN